MIDRRGEAESFLFVKILAVSVSFLLANVVVVVTERVHAVLCLALQLDLVSCLGRIDNLRGADVLVRRDAKNLSIAIDGARQIVGRHFAQRFKLFAQVNAFADIIFHVLEVGHKRRINRVFGFLILDFFLLLRKNQTQ